MSNLNLLPIETAHSVPFSIEEDNRITGCHPLRIFYTDHLGITRTAVLVSNDMLGPKVRAACEAYLQVLGAQLLDVHAEVSIS
jgi:hypothetical protein